MCLSLDEELTQVLIILQVTAPSKVALLIDRVPDGIVRVVWLTPAPCALTPKRAEKHYFIPPCISLQISGICFTTLNINSLVVQMVTERSWLLQCKSIPLDKDAKSLDHFERKCFFFCYLEC